MDPMDCAQVRNRLSDYQDDALDAAAAAALAAHLRGCRECAGCADSLLAVRGALRNLPPDPAPPELLVKVLAAVEAEDRGVHADSSPGGAGTARSFTSRFRLPLEVAAAVLLFASVYWYRQTSAPPVPRCRLPPPRLPTRSLRSAFPPKRRPAPSASRLRRPASRAEIR